MVADKKLHGTDLCFRARDIPLNGACRTVRSKDDPRRRSPLPGTHAGRITCPNVGTVNVALTVFDATAASASDSFSLLHTAPIPISGIISNITTNGIAVDNQVITVDDSTIYGGAGDPQGLADFNLGDCVVVGPSSSGPLASWIYRPCG